MLNPTAAQIVRNIETTLADVVQPHVTDTAARSALATVGHLLRHVVLRIEHEDKLLEDDLTAARSLLAKLRAYLAAKGGDAQAELIDRVLAQNETSRSRNAALLRQTIQDTLVYLQERRDARSGDPAYTQARDAIRRYMTAQLIAEGALIHPAFADQGPRR